MRQYNLKELRPNLLLVETDSFEHAENSEVRDACTKRARAPGPACDIFRQISHYADGLFTLYDTREPLASDGASFIYEDPDGGFWVRSRVPSRSEIIHRCIVGQPPVNRRPVYRYFPRRNWPFRMRCLRLERRLL